MADRTYFIKPMKHIYHMEEAPFNAHFLSGQWPCKNVRVSSSRVDRRWDQLTYRTLDDTEVVQSIPIFRQSDGTYSSLILTETDLAEVTTGSGETYKYRTDSYTTGTISGVSGTTVTGSGTDFTEVAAGDKFIVDSDHSAAVELDTNWATIDSVTDGTHLELTANYTGSGTGTYKIRRVYSCPDYERWGYAVVDGNFCFFNGNVPVQYWDGSATYASDLNATYADRARYGVAFANRLILADLYVASTRNPWRVSASEEGDPTDFAGDTGVTTAANYDFVDSEEPITGLGVSSGQLIVFKKTMYHIGQRTGIATDPLAFPRNYRGVGLYAPYSIVHYMSTVAWLGIDDFYTMNGDIAVSIGAPIRRKFFSIIDDDSLEAVFGVNNMRYSEILWVANTQSGQYVFCWNYKENVWTSYEFSADLTGLGGIGF